MKLLIIWILLSFILVCPISLYYIIMNLYARKSWNISLDEEYKPRISIVVPTYNEKQIIDDKLNNLIKIEYPKEKMEIIVIDSGSKDSTVDIIEKFISMNFEYDIKFVKEKIRKGKGSALNNAIQYANGEIIIVSDADNFIAPNSIKNLTRYFKDPTIGAVAGDENFGENNSTCMKIENIYKKGYRILRSGESKLDSTTFLDNNLSAYRSLFLNRFESENGADDCFTALDLIQRGYKTIFVTDVSFHNPFPYTWKNNFRIKIRRSQHQVLLWIESLKLLYKRKLRLNKLIAINNILFHLVNPIIFLFEVLVTLVIFIEYPIFLTLLAFMIFEKIRIPFLAYIIGNIILLIAIYKVLKGEKQVIWQTVRS